MNKRQVDKHVRENCEQMYVIFFVLYMMGIFGKTRFCRTKLSNGYWHEGLKVTPVCLFPTYIDSMCHFYVFGFKLFILIFDPTMSMRFLTWAITWICINFKLATHFMTCLLVYLYISQTVVILFWKWILHLFWRTVFQSSYRLGRDGLWPQQKTNDSTCCV